MSHWVCIARIVKARGVRGEVVARLLTDFPERFEGLREVRIESPRGIFGESIESHRFFKDRLLLKLEGRDDPESVTDLIGGEIQISEEDRFPLPEGRYYNSDLIGCEIIENKKSLGRVIDILSVNDEISNLVIEDRSGCEWMLPLARRFVREIDLEAKAIQVQPPPGLVELTSQPKRAEGKRKRKRKKKAVRVVSGRSQD